MESKELMLDNWVTTEDGRYGTIQENRGEAGVLIKFNGSSLITRKPQPILLTPEILEMAGFEYFDGIGIKRLNDVLVLMSTRDNKVYAHYLSNGYNICLTDKPAIYLHSLQQLYFALTGTHLKIELK